MTDDENTYLTEEGLQKLEDELVLLKEKRKEIAKRIERAKDLGDLSENAEYHTAREDQGFTEGRVMEIERMIKTGIVVKKNGQSDVVNLGTKIVAKDDAGQQKEFEIVGINEADPMSGKISNESPIGKAFMDKKVGDKVEIEVPKGKLIYTIEELS